MDGEAVVSLAQALWAGNADLAAAALAHPVHLPSRGRDAAPNAESIAVRNGSLTWTPIRQFTDKERPRQHDGSTMIRTRVRVVGFNAAFKTPLAGQAWKPMVGTESAQCGFRGHTMRVQPISEHSLRNRD